MTGEQQFFRRLRGWRAAAYAIVAFAAMTQTLIVRAATVGQPAPAFQAKDSAGKTVTLDQYRGKYVILEWTNRDCPYTKKQYDSDNMQSLQKDWTAKGVIWLTVLSSAPGQDGYLTASEENAQIARVHAYPTAALLDPSGTIGRLYSAKTTPHMFVIDSEGRLIYDGAIDNRPTTDAADMKGATNYVSAALTESMARQPVQTASTRSYGCSIKYAE